MKDEQQPTPPNASTGETWDPGELDDRLALSLRATRRSLGLSQGAVADLMNEFGFSWRQTTVAKIETGGRPVLFREAACLARIFKKDIGQFLSSSTPLDDLASEMHAETQRAEKHVIELEHDIAFAKHRLWRARCALDLANASIYYRESGDAGTLRADLDACFARWGYACLGSTPFYSALNIPKREIDAVDQAATAECLLAEQLAIHEMTPQEIEDSYSGEYLKEVELYLSEGKAEPAFLEAIRSERAWKSHASQLLTDLLMEYVRSEG